MHDLVESALDSSSAMTLPSLSRAEAVGFSLRSSVNTHIRASNQNCSIDRVPRKLPSDVCTFSAVDE